MNKKLKLEGNRSERQFHAEWCEKFGVVSENHKALCILCGKSIVSRYFNVKRHFETNHTNLCSLTEKEREEFILRKLKQYASQNSIFSQPETYKPKNYITAASFHVSHVIAQHGKPFSDGEYLKEVFLACSDVLFDDFSDKDVIINRIKSLPLSRNTIKTRILELSEDVTDQLLMDLRAAGIFSIALDESTDVTSQARLSVIARYSSGNVMKEELIKLITLPGKTMGKDIFNELREEFIKMNIDYTNIVSVTTDGSPSMVDVPDGFIELLTDEVQHPLIEFDCILHQEALYTEAGLKSLENVISVVTKIINFITARALNNRQFAKLLDEVESQYSGLLMYNSVRYLSRGQVFQRFVKLLDEIKLFLYEKEQYYPELNDLNWLNDLMFFCDFTDHFNEVNTKLQTRGNIVLTMFESIKIFEKKLQVFSQDIQTGKLKYFPSLEAHLSNSSYFIDAQNKTVILNKYLLIVENAQKVVSERFSQIHHYDETFQFLIYPHTVKYSNLQLIKFEWLNIDNLEMEIIEFQQSAVWKTKFIDLNLKLQENCNSDIQEQTIEMRTENIILSEWNSLPSQFITMKTLAKALLTMFGSTYAREQLFSSMKYVKSTARNRLGNEISAACMRLKTATYVPRIDKLASEKQQHCSH